MPEVDDVIKEHGDRINHIYDLVVETKKKSGGMNGLTMMIVSVMLGLFTVLQIQVVFLDGSTSKHITAVEKNMTVEINDLKHEVNTRIRPWKDETESTIPKIEQQVADLKERMVEGVRDRYYRHDAEKDIGFLKQMIQDNREAFRHGVPQGQ